MRPVLLACAVVLLHTAEPAVTGADAAQVRVDFLAAIDAAPEVRAFHARWQAARLAAGGAAVLPDPRLWVEGTQRRDGDGLEIGVEQELPRWGERAATRGIAAAELLRARAGLDRARADLAREVAMLVAKAQSARRRVALAEDSAARMRTMIAASEAAVAAGGMAGTGVGDVLALRTRLERMELMAADDRRMAADAEDEARGCCGLDAGAPLPELLLPDPATLDRDSDAGLRLAHAEAALAEAEGREAHSRRLPQVGVGASWERDDLDGEEQAWKVMLSLAIPVQQDSLAAHERAAQARALAATVDAEQAVLRSDIIVRRARRAALQAESASALAVAARRRGEAELDSLRQQLAGGADVLMRILARLDELQDSERAAIDATAEAEVMAADLWRLHRFPEP